MMTSTKKQKERESMAEMCDAMVGKGNRCSRWLRNKNLESEKKKRRQFNQDQMWK